MAEAEDVITDAARHATVFMQEMWRRHRGRDTATVDVPQLFRRLDLLISAMFATSYALRVAQRPALTPWIKRVFVRDERPTHCEAIPAADGRSIWLPVPEPGDALGDWTLMALQQAARSARGSQPTLAAIDDAMVRSLFEVLEANAADSELAIRLPGLAARIDRFRRECLGRRPALEVFPPVRRPLEIWLRSVLDAPIATKAHCVDHVLEQARTLARSVWHGSSSPPSHANELFRDRWLGELRVGAEVIEGDVTATPDEAAGRASRSARMSRRPTVRPQDERDEETKQGAWMVQTAQPQEHAEDPFGMQRPTDRDEQQAADEFADSLSELAEARLVRTPGAPKEILLSDDPPESLLRVTASAPTTSEKAIRYPEWDWRRSAYSDAGARVHLLDAPHGAQAWIEQTLARHRSLLSVIKRQFESLRSQRVRLRQLPDGDELDLDACVDAFADIHAGAALKPGLYQQTRVARRDLAILLLVDVSGSTDGWISSDRRIIDVEREALLLVCLALESLGEPYSVLAFSGESAAGVVVRSVKSFAESFGGAVQLRIAGLEPEKYTRAGAAIRHSMALLMRQAARHRLLLLLSDGKPNDMDQYDGRYGVEDMRQSIVEARLQGVSTFCLTIDRHTASYLPAVFGEHEYSVLHRPELLSTALLNWLRRLVQH